MSFLKYKQFIGTESNNNMKILIVLSVFLVFLQLASAHEGEEELTGGYSLSFNVLPSPSVGPETFLELLAEYPNETLVEKLDVKFTVDRHDIGVSDVQQVSEREPGHYVAKYSFSKGGLWEVHVEFLSDGKEIRKTFNFEVKESSNYFFGIDQNLLIVAIIIVLLALIWFSGLRGKKHLKRSAMSTVLVLVLVGLGYSLSTYISTGAAAEGVITCPDASKPNECLWQAHWHAYLHIETCGQEQRLATEVGALTGPHTHEEKNTIHWHDRILIDKPTGTLKDSIPLTLGAFFDAIQVTFSSDKILDKKNGDLCSGKTGSLKVFRKKKEEFEFKKFNDDSRDLVWRDRTVVALVFDEKTEQETLDYLNKRNIEFPVLGTG